MKNSSLWSMGIVGVVLMTAGAVAACDPGPTHQSAPNPAEINHQAAYAVVEMPDGFRNIAEKCDSGGNMILVSSRGELLDNNSAGALPSAVAVILNDPRCKR